MKVAIKGKSVPLAALLATLFVSIAVGVYAWQVYYNSLATVSLTVKKASATAQPVLIQIGLVDSGEDFEGCGKANVTIQNAKELVAEFNVSDLDDAEKAAVQSLQVEIGEDLDDDVILDPEEVWGTIDVLSPNAFSKTLSKGTHDILVKASGTAAYPEEDIIISFKVTITLTTP
ncbi:MAG: hypothetical protein QXE76_04610 [Candidatus Bathyarchaeia archaeon]